VGGCHDGDGGALSAILAARLRCRAAVGALARLAVAQRISPGGPAVWAAAVIATLLLLRWPRLHPLALFATSGALFGATALW